MNAWQVIPLLAAVFIGSRFGIVGVAAGMSLVLSGFAIWFIVITNKALDLPIMSLFRAVMPALVSSGVMYVVVSQFMRLAAQMQLGAPWVLSIGVCIGAATYVLCMLICFRRNYQEIHCSMPKDLRVDWALQQAIPYGVAEI